MYGYQIILKQTIEDYGIPECLYSDYRTVFQSTKRNLTIEDELAGKQIKATRYGNMLQHLGIDIISTINPMAKGRIERLWKTFQDRLYNEMKKNNVDNIDKANVFLKDYIIKKIETSKMHIVVLAEDGVVRALCGGYPSLGIIHDNFINVQDITIVEDENGIDMPYIYQNNEFKELYID